jgi:hypothetical protein
MCIYRRRISEDEEGKEKKLGPWRQVGQHVGARGSKRVNAVLNRRTRPASSLKLTTLLA